MKKKSLFDSNPHLGDLRKYRDALIKSVASSTAIETGGSVESIARQIAGVIDKHTLKAPVKPDSTS